ncbi:MAG: histidine--tRNA ligase [Flammeovirgaceae bacterium]
MAEKPSIPRGTRDFGTVQMSKRYYIFETIKHTFRKFGFQPIETPAMENLSVLLGKYGEEGDRLIFRILNSGDFLKDSKVEDYEKGSKFLVSKIAEKGLRYDLTVPFARYVVMNRHELTFPFKRYQMQPVWRGDNPQKGRYREFYQCDADVVGTDSLICEAEIVAMIQEVFQNLGIKEYGIKINNRKILAALAEVVGAPGKEAELCVAIDKLDKIGQEKVNEELKEKGFSEGSIQKLQPILNINGSNEAQLEQLKAIFANSQIGTKGVNELNEVLKFVNFMNLDSSKVEFDVSLARGLSYYTGAIFEVKVKNVQIGSVSGGGRYDNLTGVFGMEGVSGVGFSFGVDRLYDVLEELKLFPTQSADSTQVLVCCFDNEGLGFGLSIAQGFRKAGIRTEIYPTAAKINKQLEYANKKQIPFAAVIGTNEIKEQKLMLKNLMLGEQKLLNLQEAIELILKG